jgi:hypothetical protein
VREQERYFGPIVVDIRGWFSSRKGRGNASEESRVDMCPELARLTSADDKVRDEAHNNTGGIMEGYGAPELGRALMVRERDVEPPNQC